MHVHIRNVTILRIQDTRIFPKIIKNNENKNKNELSKQLEQGQIHRNIDHMEGCQWGGEWGRMGENTGNKKHKWQVQNKQGEVKNNLGNVEAKELMCMTHGHELRWGNDGGRWDTGWRGIRGEKMGQLWYHTQ